MTDLFSAYSAIRVAPSPAPSSPRWGRGEWGYDENKGVGSLFLTAQERLRFPTPFLSPATGLIVDTIADVAFVTYDIYRLAMDGRKGLDENLTALGLDVGAIFVPGVTGLGPASRGAKGLLGKNPRPKPTTGRTDTDLPGGRPVAKSIFKNLTEGQPVITDKLANGGVRRHTPDNSVQIRMNPDGTTRLDLKGRGSLGSERIHFNK